MAPMRIADAVHHLARIVHELHAFQIARRDRPRRHGFVLQSFPEPAPVLAPEQDDGKIVDFSGLDQGQGFE